VRIEIFNILGQRVRTLVDEHLRPGHKLVDWDGKDDSGEEVSSGIYFYRIATEEFSEAKKMLLLK
jgi:flagellar hook assembly protein FlgD